MINFFKTEYLSPNISEETLEHKERKTMTTKTQRHKDKFNKTWCLRGKFI
jgi:hypothetical protein